MTAVIGVMIVVIVISYRILLQLAFNNYKITHEINIDVTVKMLGISDYLLRVILPCVLPLIIYPLLGRLFSEIGNIVWTGVAVLFEDENGELGNWSYQRKFWCGLFWPFLLIGILAGIIVLIFGKIYKIIW